MPARPHHDPDPPRDHADELYRLLRQFHAGVLRFADRVSPIRIVLEHAAGRIAAPVERSALAHESLVLFLPDETPDSLQLLLTYLPDAQPSEETRDRWSAHHGRPDSRVWALFSIDLARRGNAVVDGAELMRPNPLANVEPRTVSALNRHPDRLQRALAEWCNVAVTNPRAVGVDPLGLDVRAPFGIVRLQFSHPAPSETALAAALEEVLGASPAAPPNPPTHP